MIDVVFLLVIFFMVGSKFSEAESRPLLEYLFAHQVRAEFTCRWHWSKGDLAFWDNRCTLHNALNDYHGYRREMRRITLAGEAPA